jgi:hypothetical protein
MRHNILEENRREDGSIQGVAELQRNFREKRKEERNRTVQG